MCSWERLLVHVAHFQGSKQEHPGFDFQSKVEDTGK